MRAVRFLGVSLLVMMASIAFAQTFDNAQYFPKASPGSKKSEPVKGVLQIDAGTKQIQFLDKHGSPSVSIKMQDVKSILYERTAKPRYAAGLLIAWPLLFTKSKSHYVTIQYGDEQQGAHYAIVKLDKSNYRDALASLEAQTGKTIQRNEES
jgi:hypothetical protein